MMTTVHRRLTAVASLLTALLLTVGLLAAMAPAQAAPVGVDSASTSTATGKIAARRVNFGAISLNVSNGVSGWAYDKSSKKKAKKAAQKHCKSRAKGANLNPKGCKSALWVRNGCGAIAVRVKNSQIVKVRGAIAFTPKQAKKKAKKKIGKKARVHTYVCTTRYR